jgi:hypothetical protein
MFHEPKAKWYCKATPAGYAYYHFAGKGHSPPFVPMPGQQQVLQQVLPAAAAVPVVAAVPVAAVAGHPDGGSSGAIVGGGAKRREASGVSLTVKKSALQMNKWKDRLQREQEAAEEPAQPVAEPVADPVAAVPPGEAPSSARPSGGGGAGAFAPLLLTLGSDYSTVGKLGLAAGDGGAVGPLAEGSGARWACLVSRRCFSTEEQLARHIAVSSLYKQELAKAVAEGRVSILP